MKASSINGERFVAAHHRLVDALNANALKNDMRVGVGDVFLLLEGLYSLATTNEDLKRTIARQARDIRWLDDARDEREALRELGCVA